MSDDRRFTLIKNTKSQDLNETDIENLDIEKLHATMIKGMYCLQGALFSQAKFEFNRVSKNRDILDRLECEIFSEETLDALNPLQKIALYKLLNENMTTSLGFLQNLHSSLASGMDTVKHLEKEKSSQIPKDDTKTDGKLDKIKELILNKIKDKIK